jgi:peptidyl-tRNA hydrolase
LEEGYQAVQSLHAGIQFVFEHPEYAEHWYKQSNYLGLLSVADEQELTKLIEQAAANDIHFSIFREPDIDNQITAVCLAPGPNSKKLCSKLRLALRNAK